MNIIQAKQEIMDTVRAYLKRDEAGFFEIPLMRQRPVLLMGAPGLGKTAIMRQITEEMGIGFVSYNMTHHTRQSALGLPLIRKEEYDGWERDVTAYTMSEIVASVHDMMKKTGVREGILFLDEINCVSETLAPVILQLLQAKMFGRESVPEGWVIVAAGNPAEYNRSVREFDMATLDRVRLINVEPELEAWRNYATSAGVHGAVLSYLNIHRENFYKAYITADGMSFVTARGWEDLSDLIRVYESVGVNVTALQAAQFIHDPVIAADFADFYEMYRRYETAYMIEDIINGKAGDAVKDRFKNAGLDEKIGVIGLLTARLNITFTELSAERAVSDRLFKMVKAVLGGDVTFTEKVKELKDEHIRSAGVVSDARLKENGAVLAVAEEWEAAVVDAGEDAPEQLRELFEHRNDATEERISGVRERLDAVYDFLEATKSDGTELVLFTTELASGKHSLRFMTEEGYERFFEYNKKLLGG